MTEGVTCYQRDEMLCTNPECSAGFCRIEAAFTEARMVLERYEIGSPSEVEIACRWLLTAYEANHGK